MPSHFDQQLKRLDQQQAVECAVRVKYNQSSLSLKRANYEDRGQKAARS
jgi:hypothetical protein